MKTFDNHAPINFSNASKIAYSTRDGGAYAGIGHNDVEIWQGKSMIHVFQDYSSGCTDSYHPNGTRSVTYLFGARTKEEIIAWLLAQLKAREDEGLLPSQINELLEDLNYAAEPA